MAFFFSPKSIFSNKNTKKNKVDIQTGGRTSLTKDVFKNVNDYVSPKQVNDERLDSVKNNTNGNGLSNPIPENNGGRSNDFNNIFNSNNIMDNENYYYDLEKRFSRFTNNNNNTIPSFMNNGNNGQNNNSFSSNSNSLKNFGNSGMLGGFGGGLGGMNNSTNSGLNNNTNRNNFNFGNSSNSLNGLNRMANTSGINNNPYGSFGSLNTNSNTNTTSNNTINRNFSSGGMGNSFGGGMNRLGGMNMNNSTFGSGLGSSFGNGMGSSNMNSGGFGGGLGGYGGGFNSGMNGMNNKINEGKLPPRRSYFDNNDDFDFDDDDDDDDDDYDKYNKYDKYYDDDDDDDDDDYDYDDRNGYGYYKNNYGLNKNSSSNSGNRYDSFSFNDRNPYKNNTKGQSSMSNDFYINDDEMKDKYNKTISQNNSEDLRKRVMDEYNSLQDYIKNAESKKQNSTNKNNSEFNDFLKDRVKNRDKSLNEMEKLRNRILDEYKYLQKNNNNKLVPTNNNNINNKPIDFSQYMVNEMNEGNEKIQRELNNIKMMEEEYFYSPVMLFTSAVPQEVFDNNYIKVRKPNYLEPERNITNGDLVMIVKNHPYLESLDISNCDNIDDFSPLNILGNLKELNLNNCDYFTSLDSIANCENLEVLNVGNTKVKNLTAIKNFKKLKIFNCCCNNILNINGIENCPDLMELSLWGCVTLDNINPVESLKNLRLLDIDYTSLTDLLPVSSCNKMEFLFMDNCIRLTDIYPLAALKGLKCLLIDGSTMLSVNQMETFSELDNLEYLTLKYRRINTLKYFSKMTKMKELILEGCNVSDLSPIENLVNLTKLDITGNSALRTLDPIYKMVNLKGLVAGGGGAAGKIGGKEAKGAVSTMNLSDINVVKNLTKLDNIDLNSNFKLKSIRPLEACKDMEEVYLQNCTQLEDVEVLGKLRKITKLNLTSCPRIRDLYFIRHLHELIELQYNGTSVDTPSLASILKAPNLQMLKGNNADLISKAMLVSEKKKSKLQKSLKKYFTVNSEG